MPHPRVFVDSTHYSLQILRHMKLQEKFNKGKITLREIREFNTIVITWDPKQLLQYNIDPFEILFLKIPNTVHKHGASYDSKLKFVGYSACKVTVFDEPVAVYDVSLYMCM